MVDPFFWPTAMATQCFHLLKRKVPSSRVSHRPRPQHIGRFFAAAKPAEILKGKETASSGSVESSLRLQRTYRGRSGVKHSQGHPAGS